MRSRLTPLLLLNLPRQLLLPLGGSCRLSAAPFAAKHGRSSHGGRQSFERRNYAIRAFPCHQATRQLFSTNPSGSSLKNSVSIINYPKPFAKHQTY
jgi:hypothetical protein